MSLIGAAFACALLLYNLLFLVSPFILSRDGGGSISKKCFTIAQIWQTKQLDLVSTISTNIVASGGVLLPPA